MRYTCPSLLISLIGLALVAADSPTQVRIRLTPGRLTSANTERAADTWWALADYRGPPSLHLLLELGTAAMGIARQRILG